jgi:hypothetical protein
VIAVSVPVSLHLHASFVSILNGMNFSDWKEQVQFHLGVLDLDVALESEKPVDVTSTITSFGFKENTVDQCIYLKDSGSKFIFPILYIDDILLATSDLRLLHETKRFLSMNFEMKDMGEASYVIGIEIFRDQSRRLLGLSQKAYIERVLERFGMDKCSAGDATIQKGHKFSLMQCLHNEWERSMTNLDAPLNTLEMKDDGFFLAQFILNSLPPQYGPFQIHYNTIKDKWNVNELVGMLNQEEARLKQHGQHSVHFITQRTPSKAHEPNQGSQAYQKERNSDKCHFCKKSGHYQKNCPKCKEWFERKGMHFIFLFRIKPV